MINRIFKFMFSKSKPIKCITVVKKRDVVIDADLIKRRSEIKRQVESTCLSKYFSQRKGLISNNYCK